MRIITYDTCESTNTTLRELLATEWLPGGTAVRAVTQTRGRGQRGNTWEAEPGMNLTFSMVLRPGPIEVANHFLVSEAIAVAVANFLISEGAAEKDLVEIKWPNDILVDRKKIAGILLENSLGTDGTMLYTIAGVGININQTMFTDAAPSATSLSEITGVYYDLDRLIEKVVSFINIYVDRIAPALVVKHQTNQRRIPLEDEYHEMLWRRQGIHRWRDARNDEIFDAAIVRVHPSGHLELRLTDGSRRRYLFKEVFPA